ncbi:MAG: FAD-dependent oxidoreductase [Candidatus Thermoplasmatota archaeon]|nr:FAD-dependent oxidoreductase [Candidatus Thermoplasmatota archaeon]
MVEKHDIVIIGCGAAGATAAQFAKKTDRKAQVTIFESSYFSQYSKCGIPYAISGEIPKIMDLIEFSENWFQKARINLQLNTSVTEINAEKQFITAEKNDGSIIKKQYSDLIFATGATPIIPPIENIYYENSNQLRKNIFTVRTIIDAKHIAAAAQPGIHATIVGAGLIGLEMADSLFKRGLQVTIIEALPTILTNMLDEDMSNPLLKKIGETVSLHVNTFAKEVIIDEEENITSVIAKDNETQKQVEIKTDILIIAAGIKPNTDLAKQIGCAIGPTEGIQVDDYSYTTLPSVYAVGDCTEYVEFVTGTAIPIGLGSIAVRQGIAAGTNAAGGSYQLPKGFLQTATSEFFGIEIGSVGPSIQIRKDMDIITAKHTSLTKPDYFPGGTPITLKTIIDAESGIIIGAQAVGENAAQRVNTYATAVLAKLHIDTFRKLETAYAPPIAPTLDVVTLAADIASMKWQRKK